MASDSRLSNSEAFRANDEMMKMLKGREYILDIMEILEKNGFEAVGFNPGITFYRKSDVKNGVYRKSYRFDADQIKVVLELLND